ncbi:hypothetical protein AGMMS50239_11060 [Bacteroidia bacterium]|nr:hypothetical protein AGMMS50239_11060 [Bacteroidia bacterium]
MKYTFTLFWISIVWLSLIPNLFGQTSEKLAPDNVTIKIIGTLYSVNYDNGLSSISVNTKSNVFDGNLNTFFASYDRSYTWVGLDLGDPHVITKIKYAPRPNFGVRLQLGVFEGANLADFSDAIPFYMITDVPKEGQLTEKTVANSRGFRYVRYISPSDVRCNIAELEFYGYKSAGNDSQLTQIANIPDVIVHTENNREINSKEIYVNGTVTFISKDGTDIFTSKMEIRGRGNASWGFEKKPYRIKLESKAKVLEHPAEARNWTLISNHGDKTLIRNLLAFDISQRLRMPYTPAGRLVNLYLNGEYKGCYQFCDHIDVRKERVNIKEMKPTDIAGDALTGGYHIEVDAYADQEKSWFKSNRQTPVTIKSPDSDEIVSQQTNYIVSQFNRLEAAIFASNYTDTDEGFRKYMDTETFVKHFIVGELSGNTDTYWSVHMYKQRGDEKFYYGPVWDYDLAFENDDRTYPVNNHKDWIFRDGGSTANGMREFVSRLLSDSRLYDELRTTWSNFRDWGIISETALLSVVDKYAVEIYDSQELNFIRWKIRNEWVHQMWGRSTTYQGDVDIVKNYIAARIRWMDQKLNYVPDPNNQNPYETGISGLQEPIAWCTSPGYIHISHIHEPARVEIFSITGQTIYRQTATGDVSVPVRSGVYILRISDKNNAVKTLKCRVD